MKRVLSGIVISALVPFKAINLFLQFEESLANVRKLTGAQKMTDKIKVRKCDYCNEGPCYKIFGMCRHDLGPHCQYSPSLRNWKETTDFEIFQKGMALHVFDQEKHVHQGNNPTTGPPEERKIQTPNCAICRWSAADFLESAIKGSCPENYDCLAQGGEDALQVYNSDNCKALFEAEKPLIDPEKEKRHDEISRKLGLKRDPEVLTAEQFAEQRTSGTLWNLCKVSFDTFRGLLIEFFNTGKGQGRLEMWSEFEKSYKESGPGTIPVFYKTLQKLKPLKQD